VSEQLYHWNWHYYEIPETAVEAEDTVFDCGSAEGIFTFLAFPRAKHVYAFEPLEEYVSGLKKTFEGLSNVSVVNEALGDKVGEIYLKKDGIASTISNVKTDTKININTIDHFCKTQNVPINYLKADIEGYEQQMLDGAMDAITQFKPKIAITVYHKENDVPGIVKQLKCAVPGYKIKLKGLTDTLNKPVMLHAWM
jgi:FkbM family methyltransferase